MTQGPAYERWYAWQVSLRNQPLLIQHTQLAHQRISDVAGIHLVPPQWLRLELCMVGTMAELAFPDAQALADAVTTKLEHIEPAEIEIRGFTGVDDSIALSVTGKSVLDEIVGRIRETTHEIPDIQFDDYRDTPPDHVTIANADTTSAAASALNILTGSDIASAVVRVPITGVSHVLLNQETFKSPIWTNLDVLELHDSTYPG